MAEDLKEDIQFGADTTGVEAGVNRVKRSLADLGQAAARTGRDAGTGLGAMGDGADRSSKRVESATRSMQASIQRLIAEQQAGSKSSREYWESLASQRGVNAAALRPLLDQLDAVRSKTVEAQTATASWRTELGKLAPLITAAFSATALYGFAGKLVAVQREFDVLNSSLKTVTGSSAAAEREMAWLKDFAKETPFGLAQATQGFVKMKALGLDPTRAALTSFGNTASAMGKSLNQMIEAVADASTGEFERLKEFGIKAKKEGDNVSLTFQGVTTTIRNSAEEITAYLEKIGDNQFGGAMAERAATLDGAIAELDDTWDELFRTVNERNAGSLIYDSVTLANGAINDATTILRAMGEAADGSGKQLGALKTIQDGIATVFETVAVLGVNVAYVLTQVGNEIGGLAAQAAAAAQFNFAGVRAIREQMVADAEEARRQVDATTERILGARKAQEEYARWATRNASAATDPRRVDLDGAKVNAGGVSIGRKDAVDKEARAYESLTKSISEKVAQEREELEGGRKLTDSQKLRIKVEQELTGARRASALALVDKLEGYEREKELIKQSVDLYKQQADIQAELAADYVAQSKARETGRQSVTDYAKGIRESNDALQYELSLMGLGEQAREVALKQYRIELELKKQISAIDANSGFENEAQREAERARARAAAAIAKANASSKVFLDNWKESVKQYDDIFRQGFADMLNNGQDGWKSFTKSLVTTFKTTVADQIYKMFLQPFVVQIVGSFMGMTGGGGALGALGGGGGLGGTISRAANLLSSGLNIAGMGGTGLQGLADMAYNYGLDTVGSMVDSFRYGMMDAGSWSGFQGAFQAGGTQLAGALVGSVMNGFAGYGISQLISGGYQVNPSLNMIGGVASAIPGIGPIAGVITGAINRLFGRKLKDMGLEGEFGGDTGFEGNTYQYYKGGLFRSSKTVRGELDEDLRKGLGDQFNSMRLGAAAMAETLGLGTDAIENFTASIKVSFNGLSEEEIQKALQEELDKVAESIASLTLGTDEFNRSGETAAEALTRLSGSLVAVNGVFDNLGETLYATSLAGADMASQLVDLFGGADAFGSATGSYFQNFYSADEQRAAMQRQLEKQLATMNIALPDIDAADARAQYRALAEAQDLTTESGRKTWAMLIQLSDSFASVTTAAEDMREQIASQRLSLEERLLKAGGDDRGALEMRRKQEFDALTKLDPAPGQLVSQIYALEDASAIASKRFDIDQRLLIAQGKNREALDLRRGQEYDALAKLDPALAKMISQVWELEDAAQAVADREAARSNAMRDLSDAMGRQTEIWEAQLTAIDTQRQLQQESLSLITGIFDLVRSNARDLYGEVQSTAAMQATQGSAFIAHALATAKRTGYLPEQDALQQAISGARSGLDSNNFASQVDADFARLVLAGQLKGLEEIAGPQKTAAEQQLDRLDAQTDALNKQIREQQKQYDLIQRQIDIENGTYNATITVAEATAKIIELLGGKAPAGVGSGAVDNSGAAWGGSAADTGTSAATSKYRRMFSIGGSDVGYEAITDTSMIDRLDKLFDVYHSFDGTGDLWGLGTAFKAAGGTIADLAIMSGHWEREWRDAFATVGLPSFAVGTNYVPQNMVAQIHQGERIIPAADNRALMAAVNGGGQGGSNAELVTEIRALREDNRMLGGEVLRLQGRVAKLLEKWDGDGVPAQRDEAVTA